MIKILTNANLSTPRPRHTPCREHQYLSVGILQALRIEKESLANFDSAWPAPIVVDSSSCARVPRGSARTTWHPLNCSVAPYLPPTTTTTHPAYLCLRATCVSATYLPSYSTSCNILHAWGRHLRLWVSTSSPFIVYQSVLVTDSPIVPELLFLGRLTQSFRYILRHFKRPLQH